MAAAAFVPRTVFPTLSLPRSYYLGHHAAALAKMKTLLSSIDLVIECRDFRIPLTSRNPLLEDSLAGRDRLIVYTHRDLYHPPPDSASTTSANSSTRSYETTIAAWHAPTRVHFFSSKEPQCARPILRSITSLAHARFSLTSHRALVVGMPNVGKSTLLNHLRRVGLNKGKAARTGAQPGVTRSLGTGVKIVDRSEPRPVADGAADTAHTVAAAEGEGGAPIYLIDTPGVFMPYVPSGTAMLKLALCGCVKDTIISPVALADYLLFRINLAPGVGPRVYSEYNEATNDIVALLEAIARKTGRLKPRGLPDVDAAAVWMVQRWRGGNLGRFGLDEVDAGALERRKEEESTAAGSLSQARKADKEAKKMKMRERRLASSTV